MRCLIYVFDHTVSSNHSAYFSICLINFYWSFKMQAGRKSRMWLGNLPRLELGSGGPKGSQCPYWLLWASLGTLGSWVWWPAGSWHFSRWLTPGLAPSRGQTQGVRQDHAASDPLTPRATAGRTATLLPFWSSGFSLVCVPWRSLWGMWSSPPCHHHPPAHAAWHACFALSFKARAVGLLWRESLVSHFTSFIKVTHDLTHSSLACQENGIC